jgi:hypothetical protein
VKQGGELNKAVRSNEAKEFEGLMWNKSSFFKTTKSFSKTNKNIKTFD